MLKKPPESGHSTASAAEPAVDIAAIVTDAASKIVNVVAETLSESLHPSEPEPATSDDNQACEKVIHKRAKQTKDLVKAAIVEHAKQKTQDEARERNVIIHRLPESTNDDPETRKAYDSSLFNQLTKNELEIQGIEPVKLMRLGKKEPNQNRPLLVALPTIIDKREFMASLYKLKNASEGFNSLSITHDLTKEERQERRNLVREAKRKQEEETSNPREFRIRGPPGNLRIVWTVAKAN